MKAKITLAILALLSSACASNRGPKALLDQSSTQPSWVNSTKIAWAEGDQVFFKTEYSIRGDERLNGCYQLAKLETKENLLREIAEDVRGQIDSAQQSISEDAELVLNQSRTSDFAGKVTGLRFLEQYHERFQVSGQERLHCYLLSSIKRSDYESIRRAVIYKVVAVDPGLREALNKKQIQFFEPKDSSKNPTSMNPTVVTGDFQ